jgi:hypothetical protein
VIVVRLLRPPAMLLRSLSQAVVVRPDELLPSALQAILPAASYATMLAFDSGLIASIASENS